MQGELPPTAGLAPRWRDILLSFSASNDLAGAIARFLGVPEVILTCSGTAALVVAFEYLKCRSPRRTVVIPGYTCPLVVMAAEQAELRIAVCDTVAGGLDLDLDCLARVIDHDTLCVVPAHYGGALTNVARVRQFVAAHSPEICVIEDAAQAFGASCDGAMIGTAGHIGIFSFAAGKGFTLYEGGCLYGETAEIRHGLMEVAQRLLPRKPMFELRRSFELLAYHALYNRFGLYLTYGAQRRFWLKRNDPVRAIGDYFPPEVPLHALGGWRRRIGVHALPRLARHIEACGQSFARLIDRLQQLGPAVDVHAPAAGQKPLGTFVFVTMPSGAACETVLQRLWTSGLGVSKLFAYAIGDYPYLADRKLSPAPNAADFARRTLTLTTSVLMDERQLSLIFETMRGALATAGTALVGDTT